VPVVVVDRDASRWSIRASPNLASISASFAGASSTVELISPEMKYRAELVEHLRQLASLDAQQLEDQERRDRARVAQ